MGLNGLEPSTSRLSGVRSNLLSYKPIRLKLAFSPFSFYIKDNFLSLFFLNPAVCTERFLPALPAFAPAKVLNTYFPVTVRLSGTYLYYIY